jgi:hypothetical protein
MNHPLARGVFAALAGCLLAAAAHAGLRDEIQVFTDDLAGVHEIGIELHMNTAAGAWRLSPEFSYGLTKTLTASIALPFNRDSGGRSDAAGVKVGLKWLPLAAEAGGSGWFLGAGAELARLKSRFDPVRSSIELRGIAGWRNPEWLFAVNPLVAWKRGGGADVAVAAKAARSVNQDLWVGLEYHSELGTTKRIARWCEQANDVFAVVDTRLGAWDLHFGIGRGLTPAAEAWTMKAIVGIPF